MPLTVTLPDGYGYVALIALGVVPVLSMAQGVLTGRFRKAAGIPYPNAYATHEQAKNSQAAYQFNCAQRAHAQMLENMPQALSSMLFAGIFYPQSAAVLSAVWVFFRIVYAYGYIYSSKAKGGGRLYGSGYYLAQAGLWAMCINAALGLL